MIMFTDRKIHLVNKIGSEQFVEHLGGKFVAIQ